MKSLHDMRCAGALWKRVVPNCFQAAVLSATLSLVPLTVGTLGQPVVCRGDEPAAPMPLRDSVKRLVLQLDAPILSDRKRAETELIELGPDALPLLPAAELLTSVSSRQAILRVRGRLEYLAARRSIEPSRITLHGDSSAAELVRAFEVQTSNRLSLAPAVLKDATKHRVDWDHLSFWEATERWKQWGVEVRFVTERSEFEARPAAAPSEQEVVLIDGPFRLRFGRAETSSLAGSDQSLWRCPITLAAEPRLRPLFLRYSAKDMQLDVGNQRGIKPFDADAKWEVPLGDGGRESRIELRFTGPVDLQAQKTLLLTGTMNLLVAAAEVPIEFSKWSTARGVARRRGGVTVILAEVTAKKTSEKRLDVKLQTHVSYDGRAQAFESHQTWILHNKVFMQSPDGTRHVANGGAEMLFQNGSTVGVEYHFPDLHEDAVDWRFVYLAPTLLIDVPVSFERQPIAVSVPQ